MFLITHQIAKHVKEINECAWYGFRPCDFTRVTRQKRSLKHWPVDFQGAWQGWKLELTGSATSSKSCASCISRKSLLGTTMTALLPPLLRALLLLPCHHRHCLCCCCCTRLIPALRRRVQADLCVWGPPDYIVSETRSQKPNSSSNTSSSNRFSLAAVHNLINRLFKKRLYRVNIYEGNVWFIPF